MSCSSCGFENKSDKIFCTECGSKLALVCPKCDSDFEPGEKFCGKCGHNLKEAPSVDYSQPESYTPRFLADKILTTRSSIEGERKLVTVFFADVAGYTSLSEKLDPEEVHQIMDGCFKILMDEIHRFEGTINQFTGDGVMALFGAPLAHEDHAQRACHAALSVQKALAEYGAEVKADTGLEFKMRIGLNSGHVIVGSIGDDLRMDYTAVGDTTNLADRMQGLASPGSVLVSANTYRLASNYFEFESLGKVAVKGKEEAQETYKLIKTGEIDTRIGASVSKGLTRFVGRQNSLAVLIDTFEKVRAGAGQVIGIVGEAGVGKSRLLLEFINQLPQGEFSYLEGRCLHYGSAMPYLPILDVLRSFFDITEEDREYVIRKKVKEKTLSLHENLESGISPILELLSIKAEDKAYTNLDPKDKKDRTFEALRDILIRQSREKSLVLVIEDLHWIDNTTQEFINFLIDWIPGSRILLLLLYRPEYTHQLGSKSFYTKVGLDQLGPESSLELIKAILDESDAAEDLKELIINKAAGNPLFMEEFTQNLLENGTIEKQDNVYIVSKNISGIQIPDSVQGIISARMDRLEDNLKRTMQVASVIGRDFAFRILQSITGQEEELKSNLLNLQGLEFIYEKQLFPELEYIFKHALIQEVAYQSLLQQRRNEIHENIGKAIEEIYSDRLEEFYEVLAYHFSKSDNYTKTIEYLKLCIQKSEANYSNWEAFKYGQQAISLLDRSPVSDQNIQDHIEARILTSRVANWLAFPENSLDILYEGVKLSQEYGDPAVLDFLDRLSYYHGYKGEHDKSLEYSEQAFEEANKLKDIERIAKTAVGLCLSYVRPWNMKKIIDVAPKAILAIEQALHIIDSNPTLMGDYCSLCSYYGAALMSTGNIEDGNKAVQKSIKAAEETQNLMLMGISAQSYAQYLNTVGETESAISYAKKAIEYYEKANTPFIMLGLDWILVSQLHTQMGDFLAAKECAKKGLNILNESGMGAHRVAHLSALGTSIFELGEEQSGLELIEEAIEEAKKTGEIGPEGLARATWGHYYGRANPSEWQKAEESILTGMRILEGLELKGYIPRVNLLAGKMLIDVGQLDKAKGYITQAESSFREMNCDYWANKAQSVLDQIE
jgi:predicted ATPase/class 3 adenylate cyclase